jgi:hypothetical protein
MLKILAMPILARIVQHVHGYSAVICVTPDNPIPSELARFFKPTT